MSHGSNGVLMKDSKMDRRDFIKGSLITGVTISALNLLEPLAIGSPTNITVESVPIRDLGKFQYGDTIQDIMSRHTESVILDLNDSKTRSEWSNKVSAELEEMRSQRFIRDFTVVCDETNNHDMDSRFRGTVLVSPFPNLEIYRYDISTAG